MSGEIVGFIAYAPFLGGFLLMLLAFAIATIMAIQESDNPGGCILVLIAFAPLAPIIAYIVGFMYLGRGNGPKWLQQMAKVGLIAFGGGLPWIFVAAFLFGSR